MLYSIEVLRNTLVALPANRAALARSEERLVKHFIEEGSWVSRWWVAEHQFLRLLVVLL